MRSSRYNVLTFVLLTLTGCGTIHNLKDPPDGHTYVGMGSCYPFGGVTRSGLLACAGPPLGVVQVVSGNASICRGEIVSGAEELGSGMALTSMGLLAIADTPLSLVGDVVTLPIVYARTRKSWWTTSWSEETLLLEPGLETTRTDKSMETSNTAGQRRK